MSEEASAHRVEDASHAWDQNRGLGEEWRGQAGSPTQSL